jgi:hypothetical protein
MSAPVTDPIEELLRAALADARTDDRWGIAAKAQTLTAVRRAAIRQRTRHAALGLAGIAAVSVGGTATLMAIGHGGDRVVLQPGDPGASPAPSPVAGISPAWTPTTGSEWLLDMDAYDAFVASHTLPSPAPHTVRSPAPSTKISARLEQDARRALPTGSTMARQDAPNGLAGAAAVHARLADGTPVEVELYPLQQPISTQFGGDGPQRPMTRRDLATGSVLVTIAGALYGWGPDIPGDANVAFTITPDGKQTSWSAPVSVPLATVASWAEAADKD